MLRAFTSDRESHIFVSAVVHDQVVNLRFLARTARGQPAADGCDSVHEECVSHIAAYPHTEILANGRLERCPV